MFDIAHVYTPNSNKFVQLHIWGWQCLYNTQLHGKILRWDDDVMTMSIWNDDDAMKKDDEVMNELEGFCTSIFL